MSEEEESSSSSSSPSPSPSFSSSSAYPSSWNPDSVVNNPALSINGDLSVTPNSILSSSSPVSGKSHSHLMLANLPGRSNTIIELDEEEEADDDDDEEEEDIKVGGDDGDRESPYIIEHHNRQDHAPSDPEINHQTLLQSADIDGDADEKELLIGEIRELQKTISDLDSRIRASQELHQELLKENEILVEYVTQVNNKIG